MRPTEPQHRRMTHMTERIRQKQVSMQSRVLFSGRLSHTIPDSRQWYLRFSSTMYWYWQMSHLFWLDSFSHRSRHWRCTNSREPLHRQGVIRGLLNGQKKSID